MPRSVPIARNRPVLQVGLNLLFFAGIPTVLFWYWYLADVRSTLDGDLAGLRWAMPLAALWITAGPLLMQLGEFLEDRWLELVHVDSEAGWNLPAIQRRREQLGRLYYRVVPLGALATMLSLAVALPALRENVPITSVWHYLGAFVVIGQVGFTSTSGALGAVKAIMVPGDAMRGVSLSWSPFGRQHPSVAASFRFFGLWGAMFSVGAVFVPALIIVESSFAEAARAIVWAFITVLIFNGTAMFLVPTLRLYAGLSRARDAVLDRLGRPIESLFDEVVGYGSDRRREVVATHRALTALLAVRRDVVSVQLAPGARTLVNILLTVAIPTFSLALSIFEADLW